MDADPAMDIDWENDTLRMVEETDMVSLLAEDDSLSWEDGPDEAETGCQTTIQEATALLYGYALRHKLSKVALSELLTLVNFITPEGISVPGSQYLLESS